MVNEKFKEEVIAGLSAPQKTLPSKYFYDKRGDELFIEIMNLPEYYLTRAELDIFLHQTNRIIESLQLSPDTYFELIELGAGDGMKTIELLRCLANRDFKFEYLPIDISQHVLNKLEKNINQELPTVTVKTQQGDYFQVLDALKNTHQHKVVLFLGSTLGNSTDEMASRFVRKLSANLQTGDKLLLGVDLIKPGEIVLPAYDDSKGITAAFNLNLLERINRELGANFNVDNYDHQPEYNEREGIAKSYLTSTVNQQVAIKNSTKIFEFSKGEKILTEISRKYNDEIIQQLVVNTDFRIVTKLVDREGYFADYILEKK